MTSVVAQTQIAFIQAACRDPGTFDTAGRYVKDTLEMRATLVDNLEQQMVAFLRAFVSESSQHASTFSEDKALEAIDIISDAFGDLTGAFLKAADACEMDTV